MDVPTNKGFANYKDAIQHLFSAGGDSRIFFSDDVIKVNRKGVSQHQVVVVTDRHIYKYTPGKFKMIKHGTPLDHVEAIHLSTLPDTFIVIQMKSPHRDMVLDLGTTGQERYSELTTILKQHVNHEVPVHFGNSFKFNNSRTDSSEGVVYTLTFQQNKASVESSKLYSSGSRFVFGKEKGTAHIHYV